MPLDLGYDIYFTVPTRNNQHVGTVRIGAFTLEPARLLHLLQIPRRHDYDCGMKAKRDDNGKFYSTAEPNKAKLTLRLPDSLHNRVRKTAGDEIAAWVRQAIIEKLEREENTRDSRVDMVG